MLFLLSAQDPGSGCVSEEEEEEEELCSEERTGADQRYDQRMDEAAEEEGLQRYRDARANEMFPDEVDTPLDMAARIRSGFVRLSSRKTCTRSEFKPKQKTVNLGVTSHVSRAGSSATEA